MATVEWNGVEDVSNNMARYGRAVEDVAFGVAQFFGPQMEAYAKSNAPWVDRTGNARQSLHAVVNKDGKKVVIALRHGVNYGVFLEVKNQGRFAIIFPTIRVFVPQVAGMLRDVLR